MNQEIKEQLKIAYLKTGKLTHAFRYVREHYDKYVFYRRYDRIKDADPEFAEDMKHIEKLIKIRSSIRTLMRKDTVARRKTDEEIKKGKELFFKEWDGLVSSTLRTANISADEYTVYRTDIDFLTKLDSLQKEYEKQRKAKKKDTTHIIHKANIDRLTRNQWAPSSTAMNWSRYG